MSDAPETVVDTTSDAPVTDEGTGQEVAEAPTPDTETEYSLDDLLGLSNDDFAELTDDANHKGMKPLSHWLEHVPEDVRKHLGNLRSSYTRKTQALANERNELRAELEREREALTMERAALYNGKAAKNAATLAADTTEFDMFDPEGMKKEIQRQAAIMMQEMLKPAQEELVVEQRKVELERFASANPELKQDEYRMPIAEMLQARPELKLEDAFYIVKAKIDAGKAATERAELAEQRSRRKTSFAKTSTGSASRPGGTPAFKDAWSAFQYHRDQAAKK